MRRFHVRFGSITANHWILACSPDFTVCHDPWFGDVIDIRARYGEPQKAIYSYIVLIGQPISVPDGGQIQEGGALAQLVQAYGSNDPKPLIKNAINILID